MFEQVIGFMTAAMWMDLNDRAERKVARLRNRQDWKGQLFRWAEGEGLFTRTRRNA